MKLFESAIAKKKNITRENLIQLYVTVILEKYLYQYDPKKVILDLFPEKKMLYTVFMPKKEYSLSESKSDFGNLEMKEHRFINFLKFTEFSKEEIEIIMEKHGELKLAVDIPTKYKF